MEKSIQINGHNFICDRESLRALCDIINTRQIMVEVGSLIGASTVIFAQYFDKVVSIDPYTVSSDPDEEDYKDQRRLDIAAGAFFFRFKDVEHVEQINLFSCQACKRFSDKTLDLVYLDASHGYNYVKEDIKNWEPKIKPGGYIAGHDIITFAGVTNAVYEAYPKGVTVIDDSWIKQIN